MPLYNAERYLEEALESLLNQTFEDFELIISDNASTDGTAEICHEFANRDKRIRYVRNPRNLGAARNYNRVFELATGRYFKWAAGDDVCAPEFLRKCIQVLDRYQDVVLCYAKTKLLDEQGRISRHYEDGLNLVSYSPSGRFLQLMYNIRQCNAIFGVMRSGVLKQTRLIGNFIDSDTCLLAELSLHGKFHEIPRYLFYRRHHPQASSANRADQDQLEFFDPGLKGKVAMTNWRHLRENLLALKRARIKYSQKILPAIYLLGTMFVQPGEYMREINQALRFLMRQHLS